MFQWLKNLFKKKKNNNNLQFKDRCEECVWWAAEEENNMPSATDFSSMFDSNYAFCDIHKEYTHKIHTCHMFKEERFEATSESIQTEELDLNHDLSIERSQLNDASGEKK